MGRQELIARSVTVAILWGFQKRANDVLSNILFLISTFFSLYQLPFDKIRPADFSNLRRNHWNVSDDAYYDSFRPTGGKNAEEALKAIGDMGYSGSVSILFTCQNRGVRRYELLISALRTDFLLYRRPEIPRQICSTPL